MTIFVSEICKYGIIFVFLHAKINQNTSIMKKYVLTSVFVALSVMAIQAAGLRAYNLPQGGYIVVDEQNELVALGERGTVADMSEALICFLGETPILDESAPKFAPQAKVVADSVGPILGDIMFDQSAPYNRQTPKYNNKQCLTGCVATAMAEIMTFHQHPKQCKPGSVDYTSTKNHIHVTYSFDNVSFDWSKILHTYITGSDRNYTEEEADEVAKLMAACGAAVEMDYGLDASGSVSKLVPNALVEYFDYNLNIKFEDKSDFLTDADFYQALKDEFKAGRPVYMSGASNDGGHAYVMDGYLVYEGAEAYPLFHFNWGWNGVGNEWTTIQRSEYNQTMSFIRYIYPNNASAVENTYGNVTIEGIYDILGNRVAEMVPGNIYIVNGKKILAR